MCLKLDTGMRAICGFLIFMGTLNLLISIMNAFKGFPMAVGDFAMVPPQYWLAWLMIVTFRSEQDGDSFSKQMQRTRVTKGIMQVNIFNTILLLLCILWMYVDFDSAAPMDMDAYNKLNKE